MDSLAFDYDQMVNDSCISMVCVGTIMGSRVVGWQYLMVDSDKVNS